MLDRVGARLPPQPAGGADEHVATIVDRTFAPLAYAADRSDGDDASGDRDDEGSSDRDGDDRDDEGSGNRDGDERDDDFARALVELRAQAAQDERYREYFTRSDRFVRSHVAHVVRSGVEQGTFRAVDPRETAALFQIAFVGTRTQRVTSDDVSRTRAEFERYVRSCLLAPE